MSSVLEKWNPVAHDFGLIRALLDRVLTEFQDWQSSIGITYLRTEISSFLEEAFGSLLPLAESKMRRLFVASRSDWVAYFQNGLQGSDPFPTMSYLAARMGVLAMRVCSTADATRYPAVVWEVYAPVSLGGVPQLGYRRSIAAMNDGGRWIFHESGERFPFEQVEQYGERRKCDRFTREMLRDYLMEFGIESLSDDFLRVDATVPAIRLQQLAKAEHTPEYTLEQVVAGVPWKK